MLYLWIFADNVESVLGHVKFIIFYLTCGLAAGVLQTIIYPSSTIPIIGASGAIAGVLGAYMITFPNARVHTLVFLFWYITTMRIPAIYVLGFWFIIQITNGLGTLGINTTGGVAWFAHIGGFLAGLILIRLLKMIRIERI
jgi:membrane associated rhomboid family serine protease